MSGKRKKPMSTRNKVLIALGVFLLVFITIMTVIFVVKGSVPDTLIEKVLDVGQWEAGFLALIKVANIIKGESEDT